MKYHQSAVEQEVIINFDRAGDEASLYTADPIWIRKMDKLVKDHPERFKVIRQETYKGEVIAKDYTFPKRFITIRTKEISKNLTAEQRQAQAERMRAISSKRNPLN